MKFSIVTLLFVSYCLGQELIDISDTSLSDETPVLMEKSESQAAQPVITSGPMHNAISPQTNTLYKGALYIVVKPESATIFINGRKVGNGTITVSDLPVGNYNVYVVSGEFSEEQVVSVVADHVRKVDFNIGRNTYFNVTSSFSQIWVHKIRTCGPSLDIGLKMGKQYFGINYHWNFLGSESYINEKHDNPTSSSPKTINYGDLFGGAAFQWYYNVYEVPGIFSISPGFCSGFWLSWSRTDTLVSSGSGYYYYNSDYDSQNQDYFFGGLSLRISAGYKYIFANVAYSLLLGTTVGHALVLGIRIML